VASAAVWAAESVVVAVVFVPEAVFERVDG